jgi:hypothetical protein
LPDSTVPAAQETTNQVVAFLDLVKQTIENQDINKESDFLKRRDSGDITVTDEQCKP